MTRRIPPGAFDFYVGMGSDRSYRAVANHFQVSKRGVTKTAARERWAERLAQIEADAQAACDKKLAETLEQMRDRHLKTLRAMHGRALTALKEHPLHSAMDAVRTLETVIRMERLVTGEPSERSEVTVERVTRREIEELLTPDDEEQANPRSETNDSVTEGGDDESQGDW